jgi:hypothetical protein
VLLLAPRSSPDKYYVDSNAGYGALTHAHRFAVWTAARAVARNFTSTAEVSRAIDATTMPELVSVVSEWPATADEVDAYHRLWAGAMLKAFAANGVSGASYGRAAKVIAIYLKTTVVLGPQAGHPFAGLLHPPIDSVVLTGLKGHPAYQEHRTLWNVPWTKLEESDYFRLIDSLRSEGLDKPAFWHVERFWKPERDLAA